MTAGDRAGVARGAAPADGSLAFTAITHDYGDGPVLRDVNLSLAASTVHALLGMNGAGKSTLVHIATGHLAPTRGEIRLDGEPVRLASPKDAIARGIALLSQEVDRGLVGSATVHENLTVGRVLANGTAVFSRRRNRAWAAEMLGRFDVTLPLDARVDELSLFQKQVLSLVRAASADARFLFLDEPTSSFDTAETEHFYGIVRQLTARGIGIVFISHRMAEVFELADELTVLRGGAVVLAGAAADISPEAAIEAMTGGALPHTTRRRTETASATPVLACRGIELGRGRGAVPLTVGAGEVVSIFGPLGSGKTTIARTLFGLGAATDIVIDGRPLHLGKPQQARAAGVAIVPEERRKQGLWLGRDIRTHFSIGSRGLIHQRRELSQARATAVEYAVDPPDPRRLVATLSGGNQQKVAIGKWAGGTATRLLILDEPMKGIDVAAKESIFAYIDRAAAAGCGVLYLTQEPDDALRVADRIVVIGRSGLVFDRPAADVTAVDLMAPREPDQRGETA